MFFSGEERHDQIDFSWGLPLKFTRHRIQRVNARLMTGTAINVTVEAMITTTELPYESVLVAKFKDGQERRHEISGTYQETLLTNIQVIKVRCVKLSSLFKHQVDYPLLSSIWPSLKAAAARVFGDQVSLGNCAK